MMSASAGATGRQGQEFLELAYHGEHLPAARGLSQLQHMSTMANIASLEKTTKSCT